MAPTRSQPARVLLMGAGGLCLALGAAGALLPVLPTTPFVLLAAACFSRSSPAFHRALRESRLFGPLLRDWEDHRSVPRAAKLRALVIVTAAFSISLVWGLESLAPRIALGALGLALLVFLARLPVIAEAVPPAAGGDRS